MQIRDRQRPPHGQTILQVQKTIRLRPTQINGNEGAQGSEHGRNHKVRRSMPIVEGLDIDENFLTHLDSAFDGC
ncbi:hypothetical protein SAMN04488036_103405 [Shimia haliotis]|uniref:Uncharacterized protein n=1 Tax=Shimia haliotis TaxID=1280847 RepID=A0A1I4DUW5_9RHOB|nr:hypothetical protein SAMN04488036_103405 [Shimia haliotis]